MTIRKRTSVTPVRTFPKSHDFGYTRPIPKPHDFGFTRLAFVAPLLLLLMSATAAAQLPKLGYVFPPALPAGQTSNVQLGGYDLTPDTLLFVHHKQVKGKLVGPLGDFIVPKPPYWFGEKSRITAFPIPREFPAQFVVAAGTPAGLVHWQMANANGTTATAVFYVSDEKEIVEDRFRDQPQVLSTLPVGVSGRVERIAEIDRYTLTAAKDGPISVELFARRLGANFNGVLQVSDQKGRIIADVADTEGKDLAVTFAAKAKQAYTISLSDADYRGNQAFVYRLAVAAGPRIITTIPATLRVGEKRPVEFVGFGLATGAAKLESIKQTVAAPNTAKATLRMRVKTRFGESLPYSIPISHLQDAPATPKTQLKAPGAVTTRMPGSGVAEFSLVAKKGEQFQVAAKSRAIGTGLDLSITIRDKTGKQLSANDDAGGTTDAAVLFRAPADDTYTCEISDMSGQSIDASAVFRLSVDQPKPAFEITAPQQIHVPVGGKFAVPLKIVRHGGFKDEIQISLKGLPAGVTADPKTLKVPAGKAAVKLTLQSAANSAAAASSLQITGTAVVEGKKITVMATAPTAGNLTPIRAAQMSELLIATTLKPKFSLELIDRNRQRPVHRGTTYPAPFVVKRDDGFKGEILLQMAAQQSRHRQGITGPILPVPPTVDRIFYPCFMPQWLETDRTTRMSVTGVAKQADPKGNVRYVMKPAAARVTMIMEGALLGVGSNQTELTARIGTTFQIPFEIVRSRKLPVEVTVDLVVPHELRKLVTSESVRVAPDGNRGVLTVKTVSDERLPGDWTLQLRASAMENGRWPVKVFADVPVTLER